MAEGRNLVAITFSAQLSLHLYEVFLSVVFFGGGVGPHPLPPLSAGIEVFWVVNRKKQ